MLRTAFKSALQKLLPLQNKLVFESSPDFACNTYPVFLRLQEKYPQFKTVWLAHNEHTHPHGADAVIQLTPKNLPQKIKAVYHLYTAKGLISSNFVPAKRRTEQLNLFLGHGSKTKHTKGFYEPGKDADYIQVQSHFFDAITMDEYGCGKEQLVYFGYPRCDYFFRESSGKSACFTNGEAKPFAVWLPTVRKRKNGMTDVNKTDYDRIGMPLIYSAEALAALNEFLRKNDFYILFKPHPVQDISDLTAQKLSHIRVLTDVDLDKNQVQLYEIIAESSALITDYSSVFYDYLLLNRPIATTTDDLQTWKHDKGFAFDLDQIYDEATVRVATARELELFLLSVISGTDEKAAAREKYCALTNLYRDGNSTERVVDFIAEKIKL